ncbi:Putative ribonuclease H protein [Dendrobium catenatum]|uniref:Ribonuclease H protein n=1 Tax=Dendrobium catenatum TaxID=906689 RepID=A0A2I0W3H0_9ASPA|nr:Putative ribonuclease H protein [Dendrobium catenatum]
MVYDKIVTWIKPNVPFIKLNSDGSVKNHCAGLGGIIRDHNGNVLAAYAGPLNKCTVITVELNALSYDIDICSNMGCNNIWLEVDAQLVIQIINNVVLGNPQNFYLIRKIKQSLSTFNFYISHIYREANCCADWLANLGCTLDYFQELNINSLDPMLKGMITLDKAALPYIRHV